jgi:hypothetical protein
MGRISNIRVGAAWRAGGCRVLSQFVSQRSAKRDRRLRGSRNKLSEAVVCALLRDFSKHGEKAIARVRRDQPGDLLEKFLLY